MKGEIVDIGSKNTYSVTFFEDDTIETIRYKIGASMDIHPDRLLIFVGLSCPADWYEKDIRHWEALFDRLSFNGEPIQQEVFSEYQLHYRSPSTQVAFSPFERSIWMTKPDVLQPLFEGAFTDYRIFGVREERSFILPISNVSTTLVGKIPAANIPIPENTTLFTSLYNPEQFVRFLVRPYDDAAESNASVYYPLLRSNTPPRLTDESVQLLKKTHTTLEQLFALTTPEPSKTTIVRTRFYVPWVETEFGSAIRTRFEQIFYGMTVSEDTPCITLFTAKDQISRHKFYTNTKQKTPFLDMANWASWWSVKPARNIPALILFRGSSKHHYDRVTITATDMIVATHRPEGNTETIEQLQRQVAEWIRTMDAVIPFIAPPDLDLSRWELQDMALLLTYEDALEDFDLLRFQCLTSVFDMGDKTKSQFSLLRTDHANNGLSAVEVKILQMLKDSGGRVQPDILASELMIPVQNARELLRQVESKLEDDPRLGERAFRGYPTLRVTPTQVVVSSIDSLHVITYANILRYVLSNADSDALNKICPKRPEKVVAESAVVPTDDLDVDAALAEEYGDLFEYLESGESKEEPVEEIEEEETVRIATDQKQGTTYNYFKTRLQTFDPITFDPVGSQYAKKCEQQHQPIVLSEADQKRLAGTPYDIQGEHYTDAHRLETENPDGTFVCPEYWCMRDQIPLQEGQLEKENGEIRCPVCHGKLQTRSSDNPREYPLIKRSSGFVYPGLKEYRAPRNGRPMPCCFKKPRSKTMDKKLEDKYYVLSEDKAIDEERIAFLPKQLIDSLQIKESYELFASGSVRRLMSPNKGFFRAGIGRASKTLPAFVGMKSKVPPPRDAISILLKCSFLHTWKRVGTTHLEHIHDELSKRPEFRDELVLTNLAKLISGIDEAYQKEELTRLEEFEYVSLAIGCDVFRVLNSATVGCMFYTPMVRPRSRAVIALQHEDEIDVIAYVERKSRGFEFQANIYESPFEKQTASILESLRNQACRTTVPSYNDALTCMQELLPRVDANDFEIILDPFGRGQALYVPSKLVIPFRSTPLPDTTQHRISGYKEISVDQLPEYTEMKQMLQHIAQRFAGYEPAEDLYNTHSQVSEILVRSGLRVPVRPVLREQRESSEVIETTRSIGEEQLVFGEESKTLKELHKTISYAAEVYEFLLFQLTTDLNDYKELADALREVSPNPARVEPLLRQWFTETTKFVEMREPKQFVSKIRKPCTSSCDGDLCGWDGKTCKVKLSESLQPERLFHRLFTTLVENSKIRGMVLDGRTTPFFSTILYLELPHEVIMSDTELP